MNELKGSLGPGPASPSAPGFPVKLYAEFERTRGGLLYVLQGLVVIAQGQIAYRVTPGHWWSPAWLLPPFVLYFVLRYPVWRALYRRAGHVESEKVLREARSAVWTNTLAAVAAAAFAWVVRPQRAPIALWPVLGWSALLVGVTAAFGRFKVDFYVLLFTWLLTLEMLLSTGLWSAWSPKVQLLGGLILAGVGIYDHLRFRSAFRAPRPPAEAHR